MSKNYVFLLCLLFSVSSLAIIQVRTSNQSPAYSNQSSEELIVRISEFSVEKLSHNSIFLSAIIQIWNPNEIAVDFHHDFNCGFILLITQYETEYIDNQMEVYSTCFIGFSQYGYVKTYQPGLKNQTFNYTLTFTLWDEELLPNSNFEVNVDGLATNQFESYGAYFIINNDQIEIFYEEDPYQFWHSKSPIFTGYIWSVQTTSVSVTTSTTDLSFIVIIITIFLGILFFALKGENSRIHEKKSLKDEDYSYGTLNTKKSQIVCLKCGFQGETGDIFCVNCGNKLS